MLPFFQLSVQNNRLLRMFQVAKLSHLKILNLSHNSIVTMEGLKELKLLTWLSLASNSVKGIENLNQNVHLEHLDLSDNVIPNVTDMSFLKNLKVRVHLHISSKISSFSGEHVQTFWMKAILIIFNLLEKIAKQFTSSKNYALWGYQISTVGEIVGNQNIPTEE